MSECSVENYLAAVVLVGIILVFIYSSIKEFLRRESLADLSELHQLRLKYNPDAIEQSKELARLQELEQQYGRKG